LPRHGNKQCELNKIAEPLLSQAMGNTMGKGRLAMLKESENSSSQQGVASLAAGEKYEQ
jgi:hypothetical protein